eukprot:m.74182 g.74182  ORF g.74182 m.74182 type:complete len:73 (+) comp7757_c1_seq1:1-219(+)
MVMMMMVVFLLRWWECASRAGRRGSRIHLGRFWMCVCAASLVNVNGRVVLCVAAGLLLLLAAAGRLIPNRPS